MSSGARVDAPYRRRQVFVQHALSSRWFYRDLGSYIISKLRCRLTQIGGTIGVPF
jgi:hypothetical protein